jgi:plastocyanin
MIALLAVAAAAAAAPAPVAGPVETNVAMIDKTFSPGRVTVLVGEQVRWTNQDNPVHTVTAEDDSFDSGRVVPGEQFAVRFDRPGSVTYACRLHRFMKGTVEVVGLALAGPEAPVAVGETAELSGRAPDAGVPVLLERIGAGVVDERRGGPVRLRGDGRRARALPGAQR